MRMMMMMMMMMMMCRDAVSTQAFEAMVRKIEATLEQTTVCGIFFSTAYFWLHSMIKVLT
jgi:hypothetical protein